MGRKLEQDRQPVAVAERRLSQVQFQALNEIPHFLEWLANLTNPNTRRAYQHDLIEFMQFVGLKEPDEFARVTRAHVLAWRKDMERRALQPATIRRKLAAVSELFDFLCEENSIARNPVNGVKRPREGANEGKTPALSDAQARRLLETPAPDTLKGRRDHAILAVLLYHLDVSWMGEGGPVGVEVFFVISGFLITTLMRTEYQTQGSVNLRNFWLRRALRILPPFYLVVCMTTVTALAFDPPGTLTAGGDPRRTGYAIGY